ncbi:hypothetical protein N0V88_003971 [Collariella sp. IMI 366227]|nr:hypothetical protein N0V88_003971 [Collariella sp. IMI 366227]
MTSTISSSTSIKFSSTDVKSSITTSAPALSNSPAMPGIVKNCDGFYKVVSGDGCESITQKNGITMTQFQSRNTEINADCTNLWFDYSVCVRVGASSSPEPKVSGTVGNCRWYYQITFGEGCWDIYTNAGISFDQFRAWNTYVNAKCTNLWLGYYVCVGV